MYVVVWSLSKVWMAAQTLYKGTCASRILSDGV